MTASARRFADAVLGEGSRARRLSLERRDIGDSKLSDRDLMRAFWQQTLG